MTWLSQIPIPANKHPITPLCECTARGKQVIGTL